MIELKPADVNEVWSCIEGWVRSSLGIDKSYTAEDVKTGCIEGQFKLWVILKDGKITGFLTTIISESPQGNICYAPWLGGENLGEWTPEFFEQLKNYLREQNCVSLSWIGRLAWQKLIKVDSIQCYYLINL